MTDPYYEGDGITLYHGDCLAVRDWLAADVLVTDPPYGMAFRSGQRADQFDAIAGDDNPALRDAALNEWQSAKADWVSGVPAPAAVFGTWRVERPAGTGQVLIWYKHGAGPGMGNLNDAFGTSHEEIYLMGPWLRRDGVKRTGSVLVTKGSPSAEANAVGHPTPKPVGLLEQIIRAAPAGVVADPFAGGGSTLLAARNLGRRAIGVELDERYCEIIARRLSQMCLEF